MDNNNTNNVERFTLHTEHGIMNPQTWEQGCGIAAHFIAEGFTKVLLVDNETGIEFLPKGSFYGVDQIISLVFA